MGTFLDTARANIMQILAGVAGAAALGLLIALLLTRATLADVKLDRENERIAHRITVANYRIAAAQATLADAQNVLRVKREQDAITERISSDYETRIADARARADALRMRLSTAGTNPRSADAAPVPAVPDAAGQPDAAPGEDRFSVGDRLIATEQAIRLDALQAWVREQVAVDVGGEP